MGTTPAIEQRVASLLSAMTLAEKIGQTNQLHAEGSRTIGDAIRRGEVGSILNEVNVDTVNELQRIAVEESRHGIPLLVGRDVIHGFRTVMPIPLGQAATWNPGIVRDAARAAACEAAACGINWTFAPMLDLTREPRWGRIAESLGEDAHLASVLGVAMVQGFQGDDLAAPGSIAACAKHFAGYGAVESGRDYATTDISEHELRNFYLLPFKAAVDASVSTIMASFSDLNGVPASGNGFLMRQILRDEWGFDGFVVSDWDSVRQLIVHGLAQDEKAAALAAASAGIDMEMFGQSYLRHLQTLVGDGQIEEQRIDEMVASILRLKFQLGLFDNPYTDPPGLAAPIGAKALAIARTAALQSVVMLKNDHAVLPLSASALSSIAIIGPLADAPHEQMGTWVFDGDVKPVVTPLAAIRETQGKDLEIRYLRAMENSRSRDTTGFNDAADAARNSDLAVLFLGEESILSGEAHSRANIDLPGAQAELVRRVRAAGKPVIAVIMAGRPLTLGNIVDHVDAILYAWHPGTMGGPAIADLLFGIESPSGKLPVTFPRVVGQIPIYYNQKNTGKPPSPSTIVHIDDIDQHAPQTSLGMTSFHLDTDYTPLYAFGHGLSYTEFSYSNIRIDKSPLRLDETLRISAEVTNAGNVAADEVVQLYIRDLVGSVTRPVRELKSFRRVHLKPGQSTIVEFSLSTDELAFYDRDMRLITEPGKFHAWIGGSSETDLRTGFAIVQ